MKSLAFIFLLALTAFAEDAGPTVGIEGRLDVLLPAPELKAKPADRFAAFTLRVASAQPRGTLFQYDLRYIGYVPGKYDLRAYLLRDDGTPTDDLPPMPVTVAGVLPFDHRGELNLNHDQPLAKLGGYRWILGGIAALWILAAFPLFLARRARGKAAGAAVSIAPPTLADRLRPLVESATAGQLTGDQQAQLERLLLAHWRQKLGLEKMEPGEAMSALRDHPEAGALLRTLEDWLHRRPGTTKVDVEAMLAPYGKPETAEAAQT